MSCKICYQVGNGFSEEIKIAAAFLDCGDYTNAFKTALPLAKTGNTAAQCMVGSFLAVGLGVEANGIAAEIWLLKAGEKGCGLAWNNLSTLYTTGDGNTLLPDRDKAIECKNKATENGFDLVRDPDL